MTEIAFIIVIARFNRSRLHFNYVQAPLHAAHFKTPGSNTVYQLHPGPYVYISRFPSPFSSRFLAALGIIINH